MDEIIQLCCFGCSQNAGLIGFWVPVGNVVVKGIVEQHGILGDDANRLAEGMLGHVEKILTIDQDASALRIIKAQQQPADRGFAGTRGPDDRCGGAGGYRKTDVMEDGALAFVAKADVSKLDGTPLVSQRLGMSRISDFRFFIH